MKTLKTIINEKSLSDKQKQIAKLAGRKDKLDSADFARLRAVKEAKAKNPSTHCKEAVAYHNLAVKFGDIDCGNILEYAPCGYKFKKSGKLIKETKLDAELNEVLSKDASASDWIHDFVHSDDPRFAGKSKKERIKMALGAYYDKQRSNESFVKEKSKTHCEVKELAKTTLERAKSKIC